MELPADAMKYSETPVFTEATVPQKILSVHDTKAGVWGKLVVLSGMLDFVFLGPPPVERRVRTGDSVVIPPTVPHRVALAGAVSFKVEFYRVAP